MNKIDIDAIIKRFLLRMSIKEENETKLIPYKNTSLWVFLFFIISFTLCVGLIFFGLIQS